MNKPNGAECSLLQIDEMVQFERTEKVSFDGCAIPMNQLHAELGRTIIR